MTTETTDEKVKIVNLADASPRELREYYNNLRLSDPLHQYPKKMLMLLGNCRQRAHGASNYDGNLAGSPEKIVFSEEEAAEFIEKFEHRSHWWLIEIDHIGLYTKADGLVIDRS